MRRHHLAVALAATVLIAVGCSDGGDDAASESTAGASTTDRSTAPVSTPPASTEPASSLPARTEPASSIPASTAPAGTMPTRPSAGSSTAPTPASTTTAPATREMVLARDGLGVASFGDDAERALATISAVLGEPTSDSGWVEPFAVSHCPGTETRAVSWGYLNAWFGDATTPGAKTFFAYAYGDISDVGAIDRELTTPEGVGVGDSVAALRAAYPDVTINPGEEGLIEPSFFVDDALSGLLTGERDTDTVVVINGGLACG